MCNTMICAPPIIHQKTKNLNDFGKNNMAILSHLELKQFIN